MEEDIGEEIQMLLQEVAVVGDAVEVTLVVTETGIETETETATATWIGQIDASLLRGEAEIRLLIEEVDGEIGDAGGGEIGTLARVLPRRGGDAIRYFVSFSSNGALLMLPFIRPRSSKYVLCTQNNTTLYSCKSAGLFETDHPRDEVGTSPSSPSTLIRKVY